MSRRSLLSLLLVALTLAGLSFALPPDPPGASTTFVLVRHAEKAQVPGGDPPLSEAGRARAEALRHALADAGVTRIVVSQFARTAQTAAPLAAAHALPVEEHPLDLRDAAESARRLARTLRDDHPGETLLVVGHSNTIPAMASALLGTPLPELDERDYDNLFVVLAGPDAPARLIRTRYGALDEVP